MCLLIGTAGVGKTLLLKRLQLIANSGKTEDNLDHPPATVSTVGTNLVTLNAGKRQVTIRELGGCMGPIWQKYFTDCSTLIFVIDLSNRLQVATACIQLLSVLSSESLYSTPVLVIFNKIDLPTIMTRSEVESLFRLEEIISHAKQKITVLETSAFSGKGLNEVLQWIAKNSKGQQQS